MYGDTENVMAEVRFGVPHHGSMYVSVPRNATKEEKEEIAARAFRKASYEMFLAWLDPVEQDLMWVDYDGVNDVDTEEPVGTVTD